MFTRYDVDLDRCEELAELPPGVRTGRHGKGGGKGKGGGICNDFVKGKCERDNFRFFHDASDGPSYPRYSSGKGDKGKGKGRSGICHDFRRSSSIWISS